jgi:hypothetical protein
VQENIKGGGENLGLLGFVPQPSHGKSQVLGEANLVSATCGLTSHRQPKFEISLFNDSFPCRCRATHATTSHS